LRILVVDDCEAVRKGVCGILSSRLDIEVCGEAANGREAIRKARELNPDLIILDITMPILDGTSAAREIRKFMPDIPILFFSMHDSEQVVQQARAMGVQGFVIKTQAAETLLNAVDALNNKQTFFLRSREQFIE
jgi:DNA-binding NarL/FixJ family response regulator